MRKSALAVAATAALGFAGASNAGYFDIVGSSYNAGSGTQNISVADLSAGDNTSIGLVADGNNTQKTMTATVAGNIVGNLGAALTADTLTYFGYDTAGGAPAFFGFAFKATASFTFSTLQYADDNVAFAPFTSGVYASTYDGSSTAAAGSYNSSTKQWSNSAVTVAAGETLLVMFAGLPVGGAIAGNAASATTFGINYLSWDGSNWVSNFSVGGAGSSALNVATYAVPVPAPVLLAGAGLVGAAALRRRMAKKA